MRFYPLLSEARIFDITLGLSLLHFDSLLTQHADQLQFLPYTEGLDAFRENCLLTAGTFVRKS